MPSAGLRTCTSWTRTTQTSPSICTQACSALLFHFNERAAKKQRSCCVPQSVTLCDQTAGARIRSPESVPLQVSRLLEERIAEAEHGVKDVRHWLSLIGVADSEAAVFSAINLQTAYKRAAHCQAIFRAVCPRHVNCTESHRHPDVQLPTRRRPGSTWTLFRATSGH